MTSRAGWREDERREGRRKRVSEPGSDRRREGDRDRVVLRRVFRTCTAVGSYTGASWSPASLRSLNDPFCRFRNTALRCCCRLTTDRLWVTRWVSFWALFGLKEMRIQGLTINGEIRYYDNGRGSRRRRRRRGGRDLKPANVLIDPDTLRVWPATRLPSAPRQAPSLRPTRIGWRSRDAPATDRRWECRLTHCRFART